MTSLQSQLPAINYLGRDVETIIRDLQALLESRRSKDVNSFFEGDLPKIFIELLAYTSANNGYHIDRVSEESFLVTARLRDSALRHAVTVGYPVATIQPASVFLVPQAFESIPNDLTQAVSVSEVQQLTLTPATGPGGTFRLRFAGYDTTPVPYGASIAGAIQSAMEALPSVGLGNVAVTGPVANVYTLTFRAALAFTNVGQVTVDAAGLANVTASVATVTQGANNSRKILFAKGTSVSAAGTTWEVAADTTIDGLGVTSNNFRSVFRVPVVEGRSITETFTSDGTEFQQFTTSAGSVIDGTVELRVGDPTGATWAVLGSIGLAKRGDLAAAARYNATGQLTLQFGDANLGTVPGDGRTIYVTFRTCSGAAGNVAAEAILTTLTGSVTVNDLVSPVSIPVVNIEPANGGSPAETLDEIRRNVPAWIRTVDKALTKEDYDTLASQYNDPAVGEVARAVAYLSSAAIMQQSAGPVITPDAPLVLPQDAVITVGDYSFRLTRAVTVSEADPMLWFNPNTVYVYAWGLGSDGFQGVNSDLLASLRAYLQARSVVTTTIVCVSGRKQVIDIDLGEVVYNPAFREADMRTRIAAAIRAFFVSDQIQPGTAFRLSDLYQLVENLDGVEHLTIAAPTADVLVGKDKIAFLGALSFTLKAKTIPLDLDANRGAFGDEIFSG